MKSHNVLPGNRVEREAIRFALMAAEVALDDNAFLLAASQWVSLSKGELVPCGRPSPIVTETGTGETYPIKFVAEFVFVQLRFRIVLYGSVTSLRDLTTPAKYAWRRAEMTWYASETSDDIEAEYFLKCENGQSINLATWSVVNVPEEI